MKLGREFGNYGKRITHSGGYASFRLAGGQIGLCPEQQWRSYIDEDARHWIKAIRFRGFRSHKDKGRYAGLRLSLVQLRPRVIRDSHG